MTRHFLDVANDPTAEQLPSECLMRMMNNVRDALHDEARNRPSNLGTKSVLRYGLAGCGWCNKSQCAYPDGAESAECVAATLKRVLKDAR